MRVAGTVALARVVLGMARTAVTPEHVLIGVLEC